MNSGIMNTNFIGPFTDTVINGIVKEAKKDKNKKKIMKHVIEPILTDVNARYYPHMMTLTCLLLIIILLLIILIGITSSSDNYKCPNCL